MAEINKNRFIIIAVVFVAALLLLSFFYAYKFFQKSAVLQDQIIALQKDFADEKNNSKMAQQNLKKTLRLDSLYIMGLTQTSLVQDSILALYREEAIASLFPDLFAQRKRQLLYFQATWNALRQKVEFATQKAREQAFRLDSLEKKIARENQQKKELLDDLNQAQQELTVARLELEHFADSTRQLNARVNNLFFEFEDNIKVAEIIKNGNLVYYVGRKKDGKANGLGVGIWSTGGIYKGEWKDNLRHGKGWYKWKDGEVYEGDFYEGKRTGKGKYIWRDGSYYVGDWNENMREGFGRVYYPNGDLQYEGIWQKDKFIQPIKKKN